MADNDCKDSCGHCMRACCSGNGPLLWSPASMATIKLVWKLDVVGQSVNDLSLFSPFGRLKMSSGLLRSGHRDKTDGQDGFLLNRFAMLLQQVKLLVMIVADGDNHPAALS
jgi:hypothetical protein